MSRRLRVAVAIPTYGRDEVLIDTLKDVFCQKPPADEVWVIDQSEAHKPEVQLLLDTWHDESRLRYLRQNLPSLPAARNRALRETSCEIVIFIDDDVKLAPGFVLAHSQVYWSNTEVVAVAGRVVQRIALPTPKRAAQWPRFLDYCYFKFDGEERVSGIANFIGCNHSVRADYVKTLGGYDEGYKGVALREETDLALRIYNSGGVIVFEPLASLYHFAAPNGGCRKQDIIDITAALSITRFAWKFRHMLGSFVLHELWHALRRLLFNKQTLRHPYIIPAVLAKYIIGLPRSIINMRRDI